MVFLIIGLFPLIAGNALRIWALAAAGIFLLLALFWPQSLTRPNRWWFKLGLFLGAIISPVVMTLIYFTVFTPIGLLLRLIGKDLLQERLDKNAQSYWIKRNDPPGPMKNQF